VRAFLYLVLSNLYCPGELWGPKNINIVCFLHNSYSPKIIIVINQMRSSKIFFILILSLLATIRSASQPISKEINSNWKFHKVGNTDWHKAVVPGCIHTDLINNKIIPDPFYRDNESKVQWIDKYSWEYKTEIDVDNKIISRQNIELNFKGLDTYAEVNGSRNTQELDALHNGFFILADE